MLTLVVVLTFTLTYLAAPSAGHPCDTAVPNTFVCDPARQGRYFFLCMSGGLIYQYNCPAGLVFNNELQLCDWEMPGVNECTGQSAETTPEAGWTTPVAGETTPTAGGTTTAGMTEPAWTTTPPETTVTTAPLPSGPCSPATCSLPECRCVGSDIPGGLSVSQVPQIVLLTFDDAIVNTNFLKYDQLFPADQQAALKNPNGCRTTATFFVSGDNTDMGLVKTLAQRGNEMASHSISHGQPGWWDRATWDAEIQGMREKLAQAIGRGVAEIRGMRAPYLALGGETQFSMLQDRGFLYDSSMYGGSLVEDDTAPLWPFTLKFPPSPSQAICDQASCPSRSYPQIWEVPLVRQYTLGGAACSMTDACHLGSSPTKEDVVAYLRKNFNRHYTRNRAPFMISLHSFWFDNVAASFEGLKQFLQELSGKPDVWQVSVSQMLDWVRNPLPMDRLHLLPSWQC